MKNEKKTEWLLRNYKIFRSLVESMEDELRQLEAKEVAEFKDTKELIRADSAEPKTIAFFKQEGFNIVGAKKFPGSRLQNTKKVKRFKKIICSDKCKNAVRELRNMTYKIDKNGKLIEDEFNIDSHVFSALWYALDGYEVADIKKRSNLSGKGGRTW